MRYDVMMDFSLEDIRLEGLSTLYSVLITK